MAKPHRIAARGIIFRDNAVLLVRYRDGDRGTFLVGPGGVLKGVASSVSRACAVAGSGQSTSILYIS